MRHRLKPAQRDSAEERLIEKSAGLCALCGTPLGSEIVVDHKQPVADDGADDISNLYLAHRSCNASRQHLPFDLARLVIEFKVFAESKGEVTFQDVLDRYVTGRDQEAVFRDDNGKARLTIGATVWEAPLAIDPATNTQYFFAEVPPAFIHNDAEIQPRKIMHAHVRRLALEFAERPVHEPSNCRLIRTRGHAVGLYQFDGQHKTTAQILLGRRTVPMKIYIEPKQDMLQQLVVKVQQEIKKQPLTRSDTLAKLSDVLQRHLAEYEPPDGEIKSEFGLVESQPTRAGQSNVKKLYFGELQQLVFFDRDNRIAKALTPGEGQAPTTDKVIIDKVIKPVIFPVLLKTPLDDSSRDNERKAILLVLNTIAGEMLAPRWQQNPLQKKRTTNFLYQGAIGWWMEILTQAVRYALRRLGDRRPLFIEPLTADEESDIIEIVETLCRWEIWSRDDAATRAALRSNTVQNVRTVFKGFDDRRLLNDAGL